MKNFNLKITELNLSIEDIEKIDDLEELKSLKIKVNFLGSKLKIDIEDYKMRYSETGISGNLEWFKKAKHKSKIYGLIGQVIQNRISKISKEQKQREQQKFDRILITKIKDVIDKELFSKIVTEARAELLGTDNYEIVD